MNPSETSKAVEADTSSPVEPGSDPPAGQPGVYPTAGQAGGYPPVGQPGVYQIAGQPGGYASAGQPGGYPPVVQPGGYTHVGQLTGPPGYTSGGQPGVYYSPNAPQQTTVIIQNTQIPHEDQSRLDCLLGTSIFATVCCCLSCGIPAIVLAVLARGNPDTKSRLSQMNSSKILITVAVVFGIFFYIFSFVMLV